MGKILNNRNLKKQKMKNWSQIAKYLFMLQHEIKLNSLSWKRVYAFQILFVVIVFIT